MNGCVTLSSNEQYYKDPSINLTLQNQLRLGHCLEVNSTSDTTTEQLFLMSTIVTVVSEMGFRNSQLTEGHHHLIVIPNKILM